MKVIEKEEEKEEEAQWNPFSALNPSGAAHQGPGDLTRVFHGNMPFFKLS